MTSLADKEILSGADNRPPMLEKDMYDSWKSRMELYMLNRQHGRMILESVENEAIQADCDVKAANIILQGLPPEVYALQERECKVYDEFDKFAYRKGESLSDFYLRFSLLLNDMNIYNMKMSMMGKISFLLGLQISQSPRGIFINQSKYAIESLKKYVFESCDQVDTLMVEKSKLDEDKKRKAVDLSHYHCMIGTPFI
nr:uncharacterized mitochondrial protein AtMg00810-like [Tanacetum cinerariifolium]